MDQMTLLLGTEKLEAAEYDELFTLLLRSQELEHVPQTLDAVIFTSAGKMRLDSPAHCFVLGLGRGSFPVLPRRPACSPMPTGNCLWSRPPAAKPEEQLFFAGSVWKTGYCGKKWAFYKALTAPSRDPLAQLGRGFGRPAPYQRAG